ncbi:MAG TPA: ABC transporter ATP-binding protein [Ktedonobacterales bacterium]|nr:ABC transporter ATP-binding protein [Ktedonobacterales bacterium]
MSFRSTIATLARSWRARHRDAGAGGEPVEESWARFMGVYLRPFRGRFSLLAALLLGGIGFQLAGPQLIRAFIDTGTAHGPQPRLLLIALAALGAAIVNELMAAAATFLGQDVGWAATNRIREDLALHLLRLDMSYHNTHTPGEFIERIDGDLTNLSNFFSVVLLKVVGSALLLLGTLTLVWLADWRVGLALTLFVIVAFAIIAKMRTIAVPAGIEEREVSATFLGFLEERIAGVEDIRANGGGAYMMDRFYHAMRSWFTRSVHAWTRRSSIWTVSTLLFGLGMSLTLGLSAYLYVVAHSITLGTVYLFFQYTVLLEAPIEQITQQMQEYQKALSSVVRVRRLFALRASITDGAMADTTRPERAEPALRTAAVSGRASPLPVRFDHVTFAYRAGEEPVLHDVDFTLPAGQVMGLLGRTGSGKTTISRLLCRLYDSTEGAVRLDGQDVRDLPLSELRRRVGVVTQDVQLFQATVRENLTFFDPRVADSRILSVIEEMDLQAWLARLPEGLNTRLEAGGGGLSAGEAQLVAFIRVFLRNPGLVILDEPSSRLDLATERLIEHGVQALLRGRTAIIIAHRLATVRRADRILTLGDGRILEYGPREVLERAPDSQYARLLRVGLEEALA